MNEGNTGVENDDDDYIDIEAMDKAFSESAKKILNTATKNLIIRTKHQEKENAALIAALKELIPIAEDSLQNCDKTRCWTEEEANQFIAHVESAIERAKTLTEPQPKNL